MAWPRDKVILPNYLKKRYALIGFGAFLAFFCSLRPTYATELAAGLAAIEEGDDRLRPAVMAHLQASGFQMRLFAYGRNSTAIDERTYLLGMARRQSFFASKSWQVGAGVSLLREEAAVHSLDGGSVEIKEAPQHNFGALLGVYWSPALKPLSLTVAWESHVFLAGLAGLFLATGRKQCFSLAIGMSL